MNQTLLITKSNLPVSFEEAVLIGERCFGELGRRTVFLWREYNALFFDAALQVTPVLYVPTSPYGHWIGLHLHQRNIYLMFPNKSRTWGRVRGVLLHEMIHQHLAQSGENPQHAGAPWCREIMRISRQLGRNVWAGKYTVRRVNGKSVRINLAQPSPDGALALNQKQISRWPRSIGLDPPDIPTHNYK
jgi:hypothetical protein